MQADNLVISTSLNKNSRSRLLAKYALTKFTNPVNYLDLQDFDLPLCDGESCYNHNNVLKIKPIIEEAKFIIISLPVYNFAPGSSAKNLIELTGNVFKEKVIAFMCAAGGKASYMSVMSLANSLMLDFRCIIVPRFVYASREIFTNNEISEEIKERINMLIETGERIKSVL